MYEFIWIHDYEIILWIHVWIQCNGEYCEIMAEFLEMNSHMVDFVKWNIPDSASIYVSEGNVLLIRNPLPFFAVSSLQALRLLHGCCCVAARRRCCDSRCSVLRTAEQGRSGGPFKHIMDVTGVEICWACLSAIKETVEKGNGAQPATGLCFWLNNHVLMVNKWSVFSLFMCFIPKNRYRMKPWVRLWHFLGNDIWGHCVWSQQQCYLLLTSSFCGDNVERGNDSSHLYQ